jgi:hypothetical protein
MVPNCCQDDFKAAAEEIKLYNVKSDDDLLEVYALYKQANMGDNDTRACLERVGGQGAAPPPTPPPPPPLLSPWPPLQPSPGC